MGNSASNTDDGIPIVTGLAVYENLNGIEKLESYGVIPLSCLNKIFLYLPLDSVCNAMKACKCFYMVLNSAYFWEKKREQYKETEDISNLKVFCIKKMKNEREIQQKKMFWKLVENLFDMTGKVRTRYSRNYHLEKYWESRNEKYRKIFEEKKDIIKLKKIDRNIEILLVGEGKMKYFEILKNNLKSMDLFFEEKLNKIRGLKGVVSISDKKKIVVNVNIKLCESSYRSGRSRSFDGDEYEFPNGIDGVIICDEILTREEGWGRDNYYQPNPFPIFDYYVKSYKNSKEKSSLSLVFISSLNDKEVWDVTRYENLMKLLLEVNGTEKDYIEIGASLYTKYYHNLWRQWCPLGRVIEKILKTKSI